ncbi:integrase, catalytic region, zinc finger, CCHC-type containing protein [Tanacetum coccineum]|uniref:Integrase, catalytic region, zinc finger, CCHC-type containing protein n=1 Tax=Tanacetum coccineum TaxID=301880 RepID=A0ABQ5I2R7_9ASTR
MFIPNNSTVLKLQTAEDLQGDSLLHYDVEMEPMNRILLSIPIGEIVEGSNAPNETGNVQRTLRTSSSGNTSTVQCYNCSGKGHYARNCPKPRVRDSKYFMEQMLLEKKMKLRVVLTESRHDFLFVMLHKMKKVKYAVAKHCLMARFHQLINTSDAGPSYDSAFIKSELCELEKQNNFLKDQLLEVSLKHEVELSVLLNHECVDNSLHAEIEQLKKKSIEIQEGLQLQHEKEKQKWDSSFKNKNTNPLDYSWISKMEKLEEENVSLDFTVQSLIKERDNVKLEYQKLFNSIKKTRSQTQTEMDELIAHVSEKTYAYGAIRAENQNLLFTISELKTRLANVEKENVIDIDVANAPKVKTLLCVSYMQNVLIPCHDNCFANYKLNVCSNVRRPLSTKSRTPKSYDTTYVVRKTRFSKESTLSKSLDTTYVVHKTRFSKESTLSKSLDTTYVVSKPKIDVGSTSKVNDKVSSTKRRNVVQIVLWIIDSGCSKHGHRSLRK